MAKNILLLTADQLSPLAPPCYGRRLVEAPDPQRLADGGVTFDNAYTNSPVCVPARAALMTGKLGSTISVYDSGSELAASVPTMGHYLAFAGYDTCLSAKCHVIGPDQLHGFDRRLTTDICPSNFVRNGNWDKPDAILDWNLMQKDVNDRRRRRACGQQALASRTATRPKPEAASRGCRQRLAGCGGARALLRAAFGASPHGSSSSF